MSDRDDSADEPKEEDSAPESDAEPVEGEPALSKSEESSPSPAAEARRSAKARRSRARARSRDGGTQGASSVLSSRAVMVAVVALAAGGAAGWFGHQAQAKAKLRAESAPSPAGSGAPAGPCAAWEKQICSSSGDQSATCQQAKGAIDLLTPSACEVALEAVPATLAKVKAARAPCDSLVTKLCNELPKGSTTCQMVTERTSSFPGDRCQEMLDNFEKVAAEVKMIDQQSAQMGGAPHGGMPPGAGPHGMPQGAMPPGAMPQGAMPPGAMPQGAPQP
jgi:hypothetical protein